MLILAEESRLHLAELIDDGHLDDVSERVKVLSERDGVHPFHGQITRNYLLGEVEA